VIDGKRGRGGKHERCFWCSLRAVVSGHSLGTGRGTPPTPRLRNRRFRFIRSYAYGAASPWACERDISLIRSLISYSPCLFNRDYVCYSLRTFNFWSSPVSPRRAPTADHTPNPTPWPRHRRSLSPPLAAATACTFPELFTLPFTLCQARRARQRQQPLQRSRQGRPTPPHPPHHTTTALAPEQNAESPHYRRTDSVCCWLSRVAYLVQARPPSPAAAVF